MVGACMVKERAAFYTAYAAHKGRVQTLAFHLPAIQVAEALVHK